MTDDMCELWLWLKDNPQIAASASAVGTLFVSFLALGIALWQMSQERKYRKILLTPKIEVSTEFDGSLQDPTDARILISMANVGLGPCRITEVTLSEDGRTYKSFLEWIVQQDVDSDPGSPPGSKKDRPNAVFTASHFRPGKLIPTNEPLALLRYEKDDAVIAQLGKHKVEQMILWFYWRVRAISLEISYEDMFGRSFAFEHDQSDWKMFPEVTLEGSPGVDTPDH